jgi:hypothetical protein
VQFIQYVLKVGRWTRKLRAQVLLQPFAYSIANRSARSMVDLFVIIEDFAIHNEFRDQFAACGTSHRSEKCFPSRIGWMFFGKN